MKFPIRKLSLAEAEHETWPVVIVGAGVAGTAAAGALAARGINVLVLEKEHLPRAKTCGGCLNARAIRSLDRLGLRDVVDQVHPVALEGILLVRNAVRVWVKFRSDEDSQSYSISRMNLDWALAEEATRRGATILTGIRVTGSRTEENVRVVRARGGDGSISQIRAGMVLACDGLGSILASDAGLAEEPPRAPRPKVGVSALFPQEAFDLAHRWVTMVVHRDGYVGIVEVQAGEHARDRMWNVAAAIVPQAARRLGDPWRAVLQILSMNGIEVGSRGFPISGPVTCPTLARRVCRRWADRLLLAGDSAGYVEPFTGEGMAWALAAVEEAVECAVRGWEATTGPQYESAWRRRVGERTRTALLAARILDSPIAAGGCLAFARLFPVLGNVVARTLSRSEVSTEIR